MAKRSKSNYPIIAPTRETAGKILKVLARKLGRSAFAIHYSSSDTPSFSVCLELEGYRPGGHSCPFKLSSKSRRGKICKHEREVHVLSLGLIYLHSPLKFKEHTSMSLCDFAFWMRRDLADIELEVCQAVMDEFTLDANRGCLTWRIWQGMKWIEIDPWKFAVELDLEGCAESV